MQYLSGYLRDTPFSTILNQVGVVTWARPENFGPHLIPRDTSAGSQFKLPAILARDTGPETQ